jgi:hypothetical protein
MGARQSAKAVAQTDDPHAQAVDFLMALYQRRLASAGNAEQVREDAPRYGDKEDG